MTTNLPKLLTPIEVAAQLKITRRQVYNLVADPDCPLQGTRIGGKTLRIYEASVAATVARGNVHAPS
jgi:predicted DNA-binding transcriptional regulator AlpA